MIRTLHEGLLAGESRCRSPGFARGYRRAATDGLLQAGQGGTEARSTQRPPWSHDNECVERKRIQVSVLRGSTRCARGFFGQSVQQRASGQRHVRSRNFRQNILRLVILPELPQGAQETVQLEGHFLRHFS